MAEARDASQARWVAAGFLLCAGDPVGVTGLRGVFRFVAQRDDVTVDLWGPVSPDPGRARARSVRTDQLRRPSAAELSTYRNVASRRTRRP